MVTLTRGVIDIPEMRLIEEVAAALVQYTPPHFKNISGLQSIELEMVRNTEVQQAYDHTVEFFEEDSRRSVDTLSMLKSIYRAIAQQ